jgi:hypothetical protein
MYADWTPLRWSHILNHYIHTFLSVHNHCTYCAVIYCYCVCLWKLLFVRVKLIPFNLSVVHNLKYCEEKMIPPHFQLKFTRTPNVIL